MRKFLDFVHKERLYFLILIFVLLFNVIMANHNESEPKKPAIKAAQSLSTEEAKQKKFEDSLAKRAEMEQMLRKDERLLVMFSLATLLILALILLGIVVDIILLSSRFSGKRLDIRTQIQGPAAWGILDIAKFILLFLFFGYIVIISEAFLSIAFPIFKNDNFRMIANTSLLDVISVVLIVNFAVMQYKGRISQVGFVSKDFWKNVFYGAVGYVALIPVLIAILAVTAFIINITKYVPERQPVVDLFLKEKDTAFLMYSSLFAAVAGPIIEELFFRGFVYAALKKYIGIFWSVLITAAMFAALHAHAVGFFPIMALGILLAYLYEKTGSLVSPITVHMVHNLSMVFLVFLVKQVGVV